MVGHINGAAYGLHRFGITPKPSDKQQVVLRRRPKLNIITLRILFHNEGIDSDRSTLMKISSTG
jgi:hypothetical protein